MDEPIEYKGKKIEVKRYEYYPGKLSWYATIDGTAQDPVSFQHYAIKYAKESIDQGKNRIDNEQTR